MVSNGKRKHRTLEELYRATRKIAKPKVTAVLQGIYRIQGPEDELELTTGTSKEAPPVGKIIPYEDIHLRTELGIPGACVAPCSSCTGSPYPTASDVELRTENEMTDESGERKVAKQGSADDAEPHLLRSSMCDDQPQTSDTSNFISACSSRDSFSENVDGKGTRRMCDTSSAYLCDGSKLLISEEQVDDNHTGGCTKSGLHNELHTVCELVNGCRRDDSSCYAAKMEIHSTSTPDPGHKRSSTYESLGDSHKQATNWSSRQLLRVDSVKTSRDNHTLTKALCGGTGGKDQFLSNAVSDTTSAQSNVTSHTLTGTASSMCPEEVLNSDENLSHLSEGRETKTLPCDHHVESRLSGTSNSKDGISMEKRTSSSMVSTSVLSKSSADGSDGMDLLCSSTNSSHVELLEINISRKQESDTRLSGYFLNKSLGGGHVETGSKSLPIKEPDMENSSEKNSISQLRSLDAVIPSACKELEEISKLDKKEEATVSTLELQGMATKTDETEHGKVLLHPSIAFADPEQNGIIFPSSQPAEKPLAANGQCLNLKHTNSADASGSQEPQSESEHTDPDPDETDVKVCDICGDAGREEQLSVCSRCNDGAEHIYCMKIMLEKVPEGEWLCEECKSKENESQKSDNSESSLPASKVSCTSEKHKIPKSTSVPECPSKLEPRLSDVQARKATELLSPPSISPKRHADGSEVGIATKNQALEAVTNGSPRSSSLNRKTLFLREGSFKNLDVNKVKPVPQLPLASGKSSNNSEEVYLSTTSSSNSRMQSTLQSPRAKFASHDKGFQFSNSGKVLPYGSSDLASKAALASKGTEGLSKVFSSQGVKPKPKVKQILAEVPRKQPASGDSRKEALIRTVSKSASFKSITSLSNWNVDNLRSESQNLLSARDSKSLKQFKEGSSLIGRQNSHKLVPSMNSSIPAVSTGSSVPKSGMMVPESDAKTRLSTDVSLAPRKDIEKNTAYETSSTKLLSPNHGENVAPASNQSHKRAGLVEEKSKLNGMAFDTALQGLKNTITSAGNSDGRKLSAGYETPTASIQPQIQTPSSLDGASSMSSPVEHKVIEQNLDQACVVEDGPVSSTSIMPDKSCSIPLPALQPRESINVEARVKEPPSFGRSRNFLSNTRKIRCFKCSELGHIAQFCPNRGIDAGVSTHTPVGISDTSDSRELAAKSKWNHIIENVLPHKTGNHENDRLVICTDDVPLPTNVENNELAPRSLTLTAGVDSNINWTTGAVRGSFSSLGKTVDVEGLMKRSTTDDGNELELFLKDRPFLPSAIPVHDFTWQGSFEVQRSGKLSDICHGIQAHLSTCASPKVLEVAKKLPPKVQLEEISRSSSWPVQFQAKCPTEDNVALYFFAKDTLSYERNYKKLLHNMLRNDLALKANFNGVELLIFTSNQLPDKSQRWNRLLFLWGVFLERKVGCTDAVTGSLGKPVTNVESMCQVFSSTMTSGTSLPLHVQVDKDLPSSGEGLGAVKATASEIVSSSAPLQNGHKNVNIQRTMPQGSYKSMQYVSDAVVPLEAQCPDTTLNINPPTNTFQTDCQTSAKLLSRSPKSGGEGHDCLRSNDICLGEVYIDSGSMKEMDLPKTQQSEMQNFPNSRSGLPTVSNTKEASSDFPKDAKLTICNQDQKKLTEEKQGEGSRSSSKSAEAGDSSQKRNHPMLIESGTAKHELLPIKGETHSLDLRAWCKRQDSHSSQKSFLVNGTKGEANEEQDYKRLKTDSGPNVGDHSTCAASVLYDLNSIFSDYEDPKLDCSFDDRQTVELSRTAERSFFSVDFGHARDCKASSSSASAGFSSSGYGSGHDMPDLELALGAGRKKPKRGLLPLFCHVFDKSSENNAGARKHNASDEDAASSLALSLASPVPVKERTQKPGSTLERLLPGRPHVNTSLLLFGGCTDS